MKRAAAGIFFVALVLNVKITLDVPYFLVGHELIAQTTGTGTNTGTGTGTGTDTGTGTCETILESTLSLRSCPGSLYSEGYSSFTSSCEGSGSEVCFVGSGYYVYSCAGTVLGTEETRVSNCNNRI